MKQITIFKEKSSEDDVVTVVINEMTGKNINKSVFRVPLYCIPDVVKYNL